jgi:hypothetical protein
MGSRFRGNDGADEVAFKCDIGLLADNLRFIH